MFKCSYTQLIQMNCINKLFIRAVTTYRTHAIARQCIVRQLPAFGWMRNLRRAQPYCLKSTLISGSSENEHAYRIVKQAGIPQINVPSEALAQLETETLTQQEVDGIVGQLEKLTVEQLVSLLPALEKFDRETPQFRQLLKAIDLEGSKRVAFGDPAVILAGAMKLFEMKMFFRSEWIWSCLKRFCRRPDRLGVPQVLQVMFLVNIFRRIPVQYSGFNVQHHLVPFFDTMSLDQMAVVSVAFFKSQTRMNNKVIMSKLMRKLLEESHDCHSHSLAMISKIIRYSVPLTLADELYLLQERLVSVVPHMDPRCLTHVALSGTSALICHRGMLTAITDRVSNCISEVRLKDMERLLLALSLFDLRDVAAPFVKLILDELPRREEEIAKYPKALVCLVNYLCLLSHFDFDLIHRVLSETFITNTYGHSFRRIGGELIFIDQSVAIEAPDYTGNRLSPKMLNSCSKVLAYKGLDTSPDKTGTQKFSYELEHVLVDMYGREHVTFIKLLPHFHFPELVVGFDSDMKLLCARKDWSSVKWGEVKPPPDSDNVWLALVIGGWNTLIRSNNSPLGSLKAKLRHLTAIGYHPLIVPYHEWRAATDKKAYTKSLIDPHLKEICSRKEAKAIGGKIN